MILSASPKRRSGPHAAGCAGCDWAHFDLEAARRAKRELFLETMERIGELPGRLFGELPLAPSPPGYRLRNRFHVAGRGDALRIGFFAPHTHRVEPADHCEALSGETRAWLPRLREGIASSHVAVREIAMVEALDGSQRLARLALEAGGNRRDANALVSAVSGIVEGVLVEGEDDVILGRAGERRLWLSVAGRDFPATARTFFQSNRYLVEDLYREIRGQAGAIPAGHALDAFGGVGLFAGGLLDAGHSVVSVEGNHVAVEQALEAKKRWGAAAWTVVRSAVLSFLQGTAERFDLAVADPPRAGLGFKLASALAARTAQRLLYVSCEPATLARDLPLLLAEGFEIRGARLYDLFAFTHRIEAIVTLVRRENP